MNLNQALSIGVVMILGSGLVLEYIRIMFMRIIPDPRNLSTWLERAIITNFVLSQLFMWISYTEYVNSVGKELIKQAFKLHSD